MNAPLANHPDVPAGPRTDIPRGLPDALPLGEVLLWQGAPNWLSLARRVFHLTGVAIYLGLMNAWYLVSSLVDGAGFSAFVSALPLLGLSVAALGLICLFSWLTARTSVYTLTNRRTVLHIGIALPVTFNLPHARIAGAGLGRHREGTGDIALSLVGEDRIAWLQLWPHARPWHLKQPEPTLRCIAEPDRVAKLLADAILDIQRTTDAPVRVAMNSNQQTAKGAEAGDVRIVAAE